MSSLRSRLWLGAVLWSIGLCFGTFVILTELMFRYTSWPRLMHGVAHTHAVMFSIVAIAFLAAGFSQVRRGVSPVNQLRDRLAAVHGGRERRVDGRYPAEVQPLVDDLNALLENREQMVRRALAKAGDLAHGLKTPLAVLAQEAEGSEAGAHPELATTMREQVERMRRQIEYHLVHARAAASEATPGARCSVLESAEGLSRTLQRLYAGRGIAIDVRVQPEHVVRGQREDVDEMLGNLLDNACKWAKSRVTVASSEAGGKVIVVVEDDGPGLAPALRDAVLQRGVRADEAAPGSGFGLAIVRDLAELYGGAVSLSDCAAGGLGARLELPPAAKPAGDAPS